MTKTYLHQLNFEAVGVVFFGILCISLGRHTEPFLVTLTLLVNQWICVQASAEAAPFHLGTNSEKHSDYIDYIVFFYSLVMSIYSIFTRHADALVMMRQHEQLVKGDFIDITDVG